MSGFEELRAGPVAEAVAALVETERRFGFLRDVEGGLFRARVFAGDGPPPAWTARHADWVQQRLGIPPLLPRQAAHRSFEWAQATFADVRKRLLHEERFGTRSPEDTAWFDETPEGARGLETRDAQLHKVLDLLQPARVCHLIDDHTRPLEDVRIGCFVLAGSDNGILVLCARVSLSVQLDTRSTAALFATEPD